MSEPTGTLHAALFKLWTEGGWEDAQSDLATLAGLDAAMVAQGKAAGFVSHGTVDATVIVRAVPRSVAQQLLPANLELMPLAAALTPPGTHPVLIVCAHTVLPAATAWAGAEDVVEVTVAVPCVQLRSVGTPTRGPFLHPVAVLRQSLPHRLRMVGMPFHATKITAVAGVWTLGGVDIAPSLPTPGQTSPPSVPIAEHRRLARFLDQLTLVSIDRFAPKSLEASPLAGEAFSVLRSAYSAAGSLNATAPHKIVLAADAPQLSPLVVSLLHDADAPEGLIGAYRVQAPIELGSPMPLPPVTMFAALGSGLPPARVAVIGGGPSGCAAAYWLARSGVQVELFTAGFRLGGKCASSVDPNAHDRIVEHGLHAFVGFYDNAFRTVREVYSTAGIPIDGPLGQPFEGAFIPEKDPGLMDLWNGHWRFFKSPQPPKGGIPGTIPLLPLPTWSAMASAVASALTWIVTQGQSMLLLSTAAVAAFQSAIASLMTNTQLAALLSAFGLSPGLVAQPILTIVGLIAGVLQILAVSWATLGALIWPTILGLGVLLLEAMRAAFRVVLLTIGTFSGKAWFLWTGIEVMLTAAIGLLKEGVTHLDQLDDRELRAWLSGHGLHTSAYNAAALTHLHETLFSHDPLPPTSPTHQVKPGQLAAGVGLRWLFLESFGYQGHPAYRFLKSTGATVFTAYWEAFEALGIKAHLFHELHTLEVTGAGSARELVRAVFREQARLKATNLGLGLSYDPFTSLPSPTPSGANLREWRNEADLTQVDLPPGAPDGTFMTDAWQTRWSHGDVEIGVGPNAPVSIPASATFDAVVLAVPPGALYTVATDLGEPAKPSYNPRWKTMLDDIQLVRTLSMQIWFSKSRTKLYRGSQRRGLLSGFAQPEPSWGDFTHVIADEGWPASIRPKHLAYLTGAAGPKPRATQDLPSSTPANTPALALAQWKADAELWLKNHGTLLYDKFFTVDALCKAMTVPGTPPATPIERFRQQHFVAGLQPTDLYTTSQPTKIDGVRLRPDETETQNLVIAGDWTRTHLSCGSVEAATQSGMMACKALTLLPSYVWDPGF